MSIMDRGPTAAVEDRLNDILLELYSLNLSIRDLLMREAAAPQVNVETPGVDFSPLLAAIDRPDSPVQLDLSPLIAEVSNLRGRDYEQSTAMLDGIASLQQELKDLGTRLAHIVGSTTGGGGSVHLSTDSQIGVIVQNGGANPVPVLPQGTQDVNILSSVPLTVTTGGLTDTQLRASAVPVRDDYTTGEVLADQTGAGGVLTFTFSAPVHMVWVRDIGATASNVSRVDPFGGTPSSTTGIAVPNGEPTPITVTTSSVKVFAPTGSTIAVYGYRR